LNRHVTIVPQDKHEGPPRCLWRVLDLLLLVTVAVAITALLWALWVVPWFGEVHGPA
jgi:hypothetical protein